METCHEHSGCIKDIENLQKSDRDQWEEIAEMRKTHDNIMTKLNVILTGIIAAVIGLFLNVILR